MATVNEKIQMRMIMFMDFLRFSFLDNVHTMALTRSNEITARVDIAAVRLTTF
jgi:hypothetical protein